MEPEEGVVLRAVEPEHASAGAAEDGEQDEPDDAGQRRVAHAEAAGRGSTVAEAVVASEEAAAAAAVVAVPPRPWTAPRPSPSDVVSSRARSPCSSLGSSSFGIAGQYDSSFHRSHILPPGCVGGIPSGGRRRSRFP